MLTSGEILTSQAVLDHLEILIHSPPEVKFLHLISKLNPMSHGG